MEEREIDLIDLLVQILYRWKGLVLGAMIGALLLGGFSFYKSMQTVKSASYTSMPAKEAKEYLEDSLSAADKFAARQAVANEKALESYEDYFEGSTLMKLDPNALPQAILVYSIDAGDREAARDITALYLQMIRGGRLAGQLAEADEGMTSAAVSELIEVNGAYDYDPDMVTPEAYRSALKYNTASKNEEHPSVSFTVTLKNTTPEAVSLMADTTDEYIKSLSGDKAFKGKAHTCTLVSRTEDLVMDPELMVRQKVLRDEAYSYTTANSNAATAKDKLKGNSLAYYNLLKELEQADGDSVIGPAGSTDEPASDLAAAPDIRPSVSKKYVLIGLIAGAFVYAGILLIGYLLDSRIHYTDDINALYGIIRIGSIPDEKKWGRSAYTRWLRKIRDRGNRFFSRDKAVELSCTGIRAMVEKNDISSLCIIGCNMEGDTGEIGTSMAKAVAGASLRSEVIPNILYDAGAFKKFTTYQGVVLLEKAGETMYEEVLEELKKISSQGMTLLGAVIIE